MRNKPADFSLWLCLLLAVSLLLTGCGGSSAPGNLDLNAFYDKLSEEFTLPDMMELSDKKMENY